MRFRKQFGIVLIVSFGLMLPACQMMGKGGKEGSAKTGHQLVKSVEDTKSTVMAQNHKAKKATKSPKPVPKAVMSGDMRIEPPAITSTSALETWEVAGVNFDGRIAIDEGVALYDASTDTLFLWLDDVIDLTGDGDMAEFAGFFWVNDDSTGVILDFTEYGEEEIIAAIDQADGWSGWIVAESDGESEAMMLAASYKEG